MVERLIKRKRIVQWKEILKEKKNKKEESDEEEGEEDEGLEIGDEDDENIIDRYETISYGGFEYNSDTESSDDEEEGIKEDPYNPEEEEQEDDIPRGDATKRIAILNCDWDNVHSKDLFVLLHSFVPKGGFIKSVTIYPSDFGLQQMELEKSVEDSESFDGTGFNLEKLRQYELAKLKYYYAIAEFDSVGSASTVYDECEGLEIEDTANLLDLRFVPDDQEFKNAPKDICRELPSSIPNFDFSTTVLKGTTVDFTWDVDKNRKKLMSKVYSKEDIRDEDIKSYLADPESSDEDGENLYNKSSSSGPDKRLALRNKYRSLLLDGIDEEDSEEFSNIGSDDEIGNNKRSSKVPDWASQLGNSDEEDDTVQEMVLQPDLKKVGKTLLKEKHQRDHGTVWTEYLSKKKEKKSQKSSDKKESVRQKIREEEEKERKDRKRIAKGKLTPEELKAKSELELILMDEDNTKKRKGYNKKLIEKQDKANTIDPIAQKKLDKKNKKKGESNVPQVEDDFNIDTKDSRFTKMHLPEFAMDPTDPRFKRTPGMLELLKAKKEHRQNEREMEEKRVLNQYKNNT
eukprot:gene12100-14800_t